MMRTILHRLLTIVLMATFAVSAVALPIDEPPLGKSAPAFTLVAADGTKHTLTDHQGANVVLLWINRRCPYSERILEQRLLQQAIRETRDADADVVWFLINSTSDTTAAENKTLAEDYKLRVPILLDADGAVAKKYGARMTPQVMVIDPDGRLIFSGAFDDDPTGANAQKGEPVTNHAVTTVRRLASGGEVKPSSNQPYGCKIKFTK